MSYVATYASRLVRILNMPYPWALAVLLVSLSACTFTYIPLVPATPEFERDLDLRGSEGLSLEPEGLRLHVQLRHVPEEGWLAVQWFSPRNVEVASASLWLEPEGIDQSYILYLPDDVPFSSGRWRVIASYQGRIVRQFAWSPQDD